MSDLLRTLCGRDGCLADFGGDTKDAGRSGRRSSATGVTPTHLRHRRGGSAWGSLVVVRSRTPANRRAIASGRFSGDAVALFETF
jgi:hypothetical protein